VFLSSTIVIFAIMKVLLADGQRDVIAGGFHDGKRGPNRSSKNNQKQWFERLISPGLCFRGTTGEQNHFSVFATAVRHSNSRSIVGVTAFSPPWSVEDIGAA
jgi:hypothetical protein